MVAERAQAVQGSGLAAVRAITPRPETHLESFSDEHDSDLRQSACDLFAEGDKTKEASIVEDLAWGSFWRRCSSPPPSSPGH